MFDHQTTDCRTRIPLPSSSRRPEGGQADHRTNVGKSVATHGALTSEHAAGRRGLLSACAIAVTTYLFPGKTRLAVAQESKSLNSVSVDDFGAVPDSEASASNNAIAFRKALDAAAESGKSVVCSPRRTYWLPTQTLIGKTDVTLDGRGATLKQSAGPHASNWLVVTKCSGFRIKDLVIDGNRKGAPNLGRDSSLLLIVGAEDVDVSEIVIHSSAAKGLSITSGVSGSGTRRIRVSNITAYDCRYQAVMTDRSNGGGNAPACEDIAFDRVTVKDTEHAGIAVNDGSRRVRVSHCVLDVNNATWDALAIRGSREVTVTNTVGRRGRNGCGISVLDAAAIARGEITEDITLSNNVWELNNQNGCLIAGAVRVTVNRDIARNNGQTTKASGFNITQVPKVRRSSDITLNNVSATDTQRKATQATAISVSASDKVRIRAPVMRGNGSNRVTMSNATNSSVIK